MTDLTPAMNQLLSAQHGKSIHRKKAAETADEFLKEAYRIVRHPPANNPKPPS